MTNKMTLMKGGSNIEMRACIFSFNNFYFFSTTIKAYT